MPAGEPLGQRLRVRQARTGDIGNPQEITILEFAELVRGLTGTASKIEFRPLPQDDPKQRCPDIAKARRILNWEPRVGLDEGLRQTCAYFQRKVAEKAG